MDRKTKRRLKKAGKKVVKFAKKEPKKFAITVLILVVVLAIVLGCLYFFGPLKDMIHGNNNPSSSEPPISSSEPSVSSSETPISSSEQTSSSSTQSGISYEIVSVMENYKEDSTDPLDPDNGGLTAADVDEIKNVISTYYASVDNTYKGEMLWTSLFDATEPVELTSYNDLRYSKETSNVLGGNPDTDYASSDKTKIVDFYTGAFIDSKWLPDKNWNREHVWCQSHGWWGNASGSNRTGGTDLHHLRPENPNINSSRNNYLYGHVEHNDNTKKTKMLGDKEYLYGYLDSSIDPRPGVGQVEGVFEPTYRVKGDVARIIMYLLVRYKDVATPVTNIIYTEKGTAEAAYDLLLKWHREDPVSNFEIRRNQKTYEIQGNRNPFIDYPNYAPAIFNNL